MSIKKIIVAVLLVCVCASELNAPVQAALIKKEDVKKNHEIPADISVERQNLLMTALSLEGQICYEWGGKAKNTGWNTSWDGKKHGMDCSGFVQWAYWTSLGVKSGLSSTADISATCKEIKKEDLKPGDLGLIYKGGSGEKRTNHVGIYLGNDTWVHCASSPNTVVVNKVKYFHYFVRVDFDETTPEEYKAMVKLAKEKVRQIYKANKEAQKKEATEKEIERLEEEIEKMIIENQKEYIKTKKEDVFGVTLDKEELFKNEVVIANDVVIVKETDKKPSK